MQIVIPLLLIIIVLVYVMGASVDITIPDFSWNKLQILREQTRQLEIVEANKTARWGFILVAARLLFAGFGLFLLYKLGNKTVEYLQIKELNNARQITLLPEPNRMLIEQFGENKYNQIVRYTKDNNAHIILYEGKPAIQKSDEIIVISE